MPEMGDNHTSPLGPLGPERHNADVPSADAAGGAHPTSGGARSDASAHPSRLISAGRLSRLDEELEALRRSPAPTSRSEPLTAKDYWTDPEKVNAKINEFLSGAPFMGIFSRTRDIIAANFNDMLDKADDPTKMIRMIILEME
ncbi:MAG: hypothetical protein NWP98_08690, partial [Erythrobacter sp.]|nr:hypothetical protein [Erythrobacter sp.]